MMIRQITVIGTGLIGGSLAMSLKAIGKGVTGKNGTSNHVLRMVGSDRAEVLKVAKAKGAIDEGFTDPLEAAKGSQVVVLACPVGCILDMLERLVPMLPPETLITDVGSTKSAIVERAKAVFGADASRRFLPGHPMAGKEHGGIEHADDSLFKGAAWLFTPTDAAAMKMPLAQEYVALIQAIDARIMVMSAESHDQFCAWISHLPQMISTAIACALLDFQHDFAKIDGNRELDFNAIGGRALREMTRTSSSPYSMWRDIAMTNAPNLEDALLKLEQQLAHIRENLKTPELRTAFERANQIAPRITAK